MKMTWEETIKLIRTKPEYEDLVKNAYYNIDNSLNVERFRKSREFELTLKLLNEFNLSSKKLLDIGCGNGISTIAFALNGFEVTAVEPDSSNTIGAGAIREMKNHYQIENLEIYEAYAEDILFEEESFDIVYIRQAMHHANDLRKFLSEASRVLKKGGILITIRDHVILNEEDKALFLNKHPLHKFYGGENAFTAKEYREAMFNAELKIEKEIRYYDSEINYFPVKSSHISYYKIIKTIYNLLPEKLFSLFPKVTTKLDRLLNEDYVPGRMYSYLAVKQ